MMSLATRVAARFSVPQNVAARFKEGSDGGKFLGKDCRLKWSRHEWLLEELPQKGKKKLRVATLQNFAGRGWVGTDPLIPENLLRVANLSASDGFDTIASKLEKAAIAGAKKVAERTPELAWVDDPKQFKWYENQVYFLEVMPENVEPFVSQGKDFTVKVEWGKFEAYSPDSDFQNHDPHYTGKVSKSPTAARKMYLTMKSEPDALRSTSWSDFSKWLDTKKIPWRPTFSSW